MHERPPSLAAILVALSTLLLSSCGAPLAKEGSLKAGLVFDRIEIADHSGDVKLVGDIDGDGLLDLVLGGFPQDPLTWWRWPDLHATTIATAGNEFTTDGELADIDGDGDLDIVAPDGPEGVNLLWFENPRPGRAPTEPGAWTRHEIGTIEGFGKDVEKADFDGDGRMDIAIRSPDAYMIFFQDGPDAWRKVVLHGGALGEEGMFSGDIDGDGDIDLVLCGDWTSNPGGRAARDPDRWRTFHVGTFEPAFKAVVADIDGDGRADILTSSSEHIADVAWFRADNGPEGTWSRHVVQPMVSGAHTLQAADMDGDGDMDVVVGQMHTTRERELAIHYNIDGKGTAWDRQVIDNTGLHNGVVADVDQDGDFDIYGANWAGHPPLRLWVNRLDPPPSVRRLDRWTYHAITTAHLRAFGLAFADVDGDGRTDIVSGPFWYRQPAEPWSQTWEQVRLGEHLDAMAAMDIDGDGRAEIMAQRSGGDALQLLWLKARTPGAEGFVEHPIGEVPLASHELGSQGHAIVRLGKSGRPALAVSSGAGAFYFEIPEEPAAGPWRRVRMSDAPSDEGIAFADIDRDGFLDLIATTGEKKAVAWWRNPGDGSADWARHDVGTMPEMAFPDRVAAADLDGDGCADIVVTEENGKADGAEAVWWRAPDDPSKPWEKRRITSRGSLNSLSVADMDGDGDADLVMAEHRGALRTSLFVNLGGGRFVEQVIGEGLEAHLGAQTVDLDNDGDLDIVSIAWDAPGTIHVWRNDSTALPARLHARLNERRGDGK